MQNHVLRIVIGDESDITTHIVGALKKRFPAAQSATNPVPHIPGKNKSISIAVGPSALRALLTQNPEGVIISIFTSSQAYRAILDSVQEPRLASMTAVYAEPSPSDQLHLISMLYKKRVGIAAFVSDKTAYLKPVLRQAALQKNLEVNVEQVSTEHALNRALNRMAGFQVLLAMPDSTIYNAENMRNILMTAYRHNQSVIGFSAAIVKAGALASSYSDIDDIITQVAEIVSGYESSGKLAEPAYPKYFSVAINDNVAKSLDIVVDDSTRKLSRKPESGGKQ